jgi:hypothetical protein
MQKGAFKYDENNPLHKDLKTANMVVKDSDNDLNTLYAMYQDAAESRRQCSLLRSLYYSGIKYAYLNN